MYTYVTKEMNFGEGNIGGAQGRSDAYAVPMYEVKEVSIYIKAHHDILKSIALQIYSSANPLWYHLVSSDSYLTTEVVVDSLILAFLFFLQFFSSFYKRERLTFI